MGRRAVTLGDNISLRSSPDGIPISDSPKGGAEVTVLQAENGWYKVRYAQAGMLGYQEAALL